jgi:hypothetical protein
MRNEVLLGAAEIINYLLRLLMYDEGNASTSLDKHLDGEQNESEVSCFITS